MEKTNEEPKSSQPSKRGQSLFIPFWLIRKADIDHVSHSALLVYCWIFQRNSYALRTTGFIYGKFRYEDFSTEISVDLNISRPRRYLQMLVKAGWLQQSFAKPYKMRPTKGYICMLSQDGRNLSQAVQQQLQLSDEETVVEMQSSLPGGTNGVFNFCGVKYYINAQGNQIQIPSFAPERPTPTAVWDPITDSWTEPNQSQQQISEY